MTATVELVEVDATNWRDVAGLDVRDEQRAFVASTTYYLCLCQYGGDWQPLAISVDGAIRGFAMWAVDDDGSRWIGGVVIDAASQGRGIGRAAMRALIDRFAGDAGTAGLALTIAPDNAVARRLYAELGFVETEERDDDEIVARWLPEAPGNE